MGDSIQSGSVRSLNDREWSARSDAEDPLTHYEQLFL